MEQVNGVSQAMPELADVPNSFHDQSHANGKLLNARWQDENKNQQKVWISSYCLGSV